MTNMIKIAAVLIFLFIQGCADDVPMVADTGQSGAVIQASPQFGDAPLTVEFRGKGSLVTGAGDAAYKWHFDDGNTVSEGVEVKHTFKAPGSYVVMLSLSDSGGVTETAWTIIVVN